MIDYMVNERQRAFTQVLAEHLTGLLKQGFTLPITVASIDRQGDTVLTRFERSGLDVIGVPLNAPADGGLQFVAFPVHVLWVDSRGYASTLVVEAAEPEKPAQPN